MRKSRSLGASLAAGATLLALILSPVSAAYLFQASVIGQAFGEPSQGGQGGQMMNVKSMTKRFEKEIEKAGKVGTALEELNLSACEFEDPEDPTRKELSACKKAATKVLSSVRSGLRGLPLSDIDGVEDLMDVVMDCKRGECSGISDAVAAAVEGIATFVEDRQNEVLEIRAQAAEMAAEQEEMEAERAEMENSRKQMQQERQTKRSERQSEMREGQEGQAFPSASKSQKSGRFGQTSDEGSYDSGSVMKDVRSEQSGKGRFSMPTSGEGTERSQDARSEQSDKRSRFEKPTEQSNTSDTSNTLRAPSSSRQQGDQSRSNSRFNSGKTSELRNPEQCPNGETGTPPNCSGAKGDRQQGDRKQGDNAQGGGSEGGSRFDVNKPSSNSRDGSNLGGSFMNPGNDRAGGGGTGEGGKTSYGTPPNMPSGNGGGAAGGASAGGESSRGGGAGGGGAGGGGVGGGGGGGVGGGGGGGVGGGVGGGGAGGGGSPMPR